MTVSQRLAVVVAGVLAGCGPELDEQFCAGLPVGVERCPEGREVEDLYGGMETCDASGTSEVVRLGDLLGQDGNRCCYEAAYDLVDPDDTCTVGRPLRDGGRCVTASATGAGWAADDRPDLAGLSDEERASLADAWQEQALLEHASVAAFSRLVLDLLALGAPAELVDRAAAATRDEIRHAARCFALASAYAGREIGPGPLPIPPRRGRRTLVRLAVESWREGCVGETLSVGVAAAQLAGATDPVVREVLAGIVRDESEHAALAWDLVAWARAAGGGAVARALRRETGAPVVPPAPPRPPPPAAVRHGVPADAVVRAAMARVVSGVIGPAAAAMP